MPNNINKYRKAQAVVPDLAALSAILTTTLQQLERYKKYIPAQDCMEVLDSSKQTIDRHLEHQRKILETKGKE